ncbi:hypothetical protein LINPERPRIM_LOCUS2533, partial [Linum perenne]
MIALRSGDSLPCGGCIRCGGGLAWIHCLERVRHLLVASEVIDDSPIRRTPSKTSLAAENSHNQALIQ